MHFNKRHKRFAVLISVATAITITSHVDVFGLAVKTYPGSPDETQATLVIDNKQTTSEELGRSCLFESEATNAVLIGEYQKPQSTELFQVWKLSLTPQHSIITIHSLLGTTCLHAYDERYNDTIADDLSQENAQQLSLVIFRHRAEELGGVENLQIFFNEQAEELSQYRETGYLPAEEMWALKELGIQIPDVYEVYDPENPPQRTRSSRGEV